MLMRMASTQPPPPYPISLIEIENKGRGEFFSLLFLMLILEILKMPRSGKKEKQRSSALISIFKIGGGGGFQNTEATTVFLDTTILV